MEEFKLGVSSSEDNSSWTDLTDHAFTLFERGRVKGTIMTYSNHWKDFEIFLNRWKISQDNITPEVLVNYAAWLDAMGRGSRFQVSLNAIKDHLLLMRSQDVTTDHLVRITAEGLARKVAEEKNEPDDRMPFPIKALLIWRQCKPPNIRYFTWIRDSAIVAIGLRTMRRPAELGYLQMKHLKKIDGWYHIKIPKSKTDQLRKGKTIPIEPGSNLLTCPVQIMDEYLREMGERPRNSPLFPSILNNNVPVSGQAVSAIVKRIIKNAGIQGRYTGHSLRIGGACAALAGGMTLEQIRAVGDWTSDAVLLYLRAIAVAEIGASSKMGF